MPLGVISLYGKSGVGCAWFLRYSHILALFLLNIGLPSSTDPPDKKQMFQFIACTLLLFGLALTEPMAHAGPKSDWPYVAKRLKAGGFKPQFIKALRENYADENFLQVLELNTLLFLKKSDYHGPQVDTAAAEDVRKFMRAHSSPLRKVQKKFGVPGPVVASLLWLESRHGKADGNFHVPSAFLTLLQADRPAVVKHLHTAALRYTPVITGKVKKDIGARTKKRVKWAMEELKAIEKMYRHDRRVVSELRGSFAGAFGMPQFIPSSYVSYAIAAEKRAVADLETAPDAIYSVANYLHKSGWRSGKGKTYVKALMKYNNSHDYASAILQLAEQSSATSNDSFKRTPAGTKAKAR